MMEELRNTPVVLLRSQNKSFKARQRRLQRRVRCRQQLRQEIYSNHHIFHPNIDLGRNRTAQNLIWDKNYTFKCLINKVKDDNSALKARIWNLAKENRRMDKQIEAWGLDPPKPHDHHPHKPYVDPATLHAVLHDQDYHIVSMKMEIAKLEALLADKEQEQAALVQQLTSAPDLARLLNHQIALRKVDLHRCLASDRPPNNTTASSTAPTSKDKLSATLMLQNQQLETIQRNLELKRRSRQLLEGEIAALEVELGQGQQVGAEAVEELVFATRRMRAEEDGGLGLERERTRLAQKATKDYECLIQEEMDTLMKLKVPLQAEVARLTKQLYP